MRVAGFGSAGTTATAVTGATALRPRRNSPPTTTPDPSPFRRGSPGVAPASFNLTNAAATGPTTVTLLPAADGYVQADVPSTNFGTAAVLKNTTSPDSRAYLKFNVVGHQRLNHQGNLQSIHPDIEWIRLRVALGRRQQLGRGRSDLQQPTGGGHEDRFGRELHRQQVDERGCIVLCQG